MEHIEDQELEAEALAAIFDTSFEIISSSPNHWKIALYPIDTLDPDECLQVNHVGCNLIVKLPDDYPEIVPDLDVEIIRGLGPEQKETLLNLAIEEAEQFVGMPAMYSVCEKLREWLGDNNEKGLDDQSMHAQMLRKAREEEQKKVQAKQQFESQKIKEELTQTETEENAVRKRRAEGTPCNKEYFEIWKEKFDKEMEILEEEKETAESLNEKGGKKSAAKKLNEEELIEGRVSGFEQFSQKLGLANFDALEKAAEEAENEEGDVENLNVEELEVDEDLFDEDDDLDDLDFDSDDESDSDDEIDI